MVREWLVLTTLAGLAAGCAAVAPSNAPSAPQAAAPAVQAAPAAVRAVGRLAVRAAGYQLAVAVAKPRVLPYAKENLARIDVYLAKGDDAPILTHRLYPAGFDEPLVFDPLVPGSTYTIHATAFQAEDANHPDDLVEVQVDDSSKTTFDAVSGQQTDLDALGGVKLTLKDRDFVSRAPGGIDLVEGILDSTDATEAIVGAAD